MFLSKKIEMNSYIKNFYLFIFANQYELEEKKLSLNDFCKFQNFLRIKLKEKNIGILITDHNVRETLNTVDRSYILHDGKIISSGSSELLLNDSDVRRVYLGEKFKL